MNFGLTKEEIDPRGYTGISARFSNNVVTLWYYFKDGNGDLADEQLPVLGDPATDFTDDTDRSRLPTATDYTD